VKFKPKWPRWVDFSFLSGILVHYYASGYIVRYVYGKDLLTTMSFHSMVRRPVLALTKPWFVHGHKTGTSMIIWGIQSSR
jgi:hypothetical protein